MSQPMEKCRSLGINDPKSISKTPDRWIAMNLNDHFISAYTGSVEGMFEILLVEIMNKIQSQKDAWSLYKKIMELKIKMNEQNSYAGIIGEDSIYDTYNALVQFDARDLKDLDEKDRNYAEKN